MIHLATTDRMPSTPLGAVDIVILAGGLGTRLASVFQGQPKALAPVAGRPILDHQLFRLRQQGASRVILALGHLADQVRTHVEGGVDGLDLLTSIEPEPLGTAGAIAHALPLIRSDRIVVMNGDSLIDAEIDAFVNWTTTNKIEAGLIAAHVEEAGRYGVLGLDDDDVIETFTEKPKVDGSAWINAGVYWLSAAPLSMIASLGRGSLEHDVLPKLPAGRLRAYRSSAPFIDIGTPESLAEAAQMPVASIGRDTAVRS